MEKQESLFIKGLEPNIVHQNGDVERVPRSNLGLIFAGGLGVAGLLITAFTTPFVLPALRKHCLPYVPATDNQLANLKRAFRKHGNKGDKFLDIGSGDGRICRLAGEQRYFLKLMVLNSTTCLSCFPA